jgi:flagellar protein FlaG
MLSELQGVNHQNYATTAHQGRAAVSATAPELVPSAAAVPDVHAASEPSKPKVQAPKPVEIKVDIEKMRASLKESLEKINESLRDGGRNLNFSMDEKLGGLVILVKNADTGEVVRQIPSDAVVRMAHSLDDLKGLLHNELS